MPTSCNSHMMLSLEHKATCNLSPTRTQQPIHCHRPPQVLAEHLFRVGACDAGRALATAAGFSTAEVRHTGFYLGRGVGIHCQMVAILTTFWFMLCWVGCKKQWIVSGGWGSLGWKWFTGLNAAHELKGIRTQCGCSPSVLKVAPASDAPASKSRCSAISHPADRVNAPLRCGRRLTRWRRRTWTCTWCCHG